MSLEVPPFAPTIGDLQAHIGNRLDRITTHMENAVLAQRVDHDALIKLSTVQDMMLNEVKGLRESDAARQERIRAMDQSTADIRAALEGLKAMRTAEAQELQEVRAEVRAMGKEVDDLKAIRAKLAGGLVVISAALSYVARLLPVPH